MFPRLENILTPIANQRTPQVLQNGVLDMPDPAIRVRELARDLAKSGVLILMGTVPESLSSSKDELVSAWVETYAELYRLLTKALFPSLDAVDAVYGDRFDPPVIVFTGNAHPIIWALSSYIVPYVVAQQPLAHVQDGELWKLVGALLDDIAGDTLDRETYNLLRHRASGIINKLLVMQIRFNWIPDYGSPVFKLMPSLKAQLIARNTPPPPKPDTQPIENINIPPPPMAQMDSEPLPLEPLESLDVEDMPTEYIPTSDLLPDDEQESPEDPAKSNGRKSNVPDVPLWGIKKRNKKNKPRGNR